MATTIVSTISPGLAPAYSSTATYAVGDCVLHQNQYWKCKTAIDSPEEWKPTHWIKADDILKAAKMPSSISVLSDDASWDDLINKINALIKALKGES